MPSTSFHSPRPAAAAVVQTAATPFLLTHDQGQAARTLLAYVSALPLKDADAQLLAVVVAIRAARSGIGNITGQDLRALRLADAGAAVNALSVLGWQGQDGLLGDDLVTPVGVSVPDLADGPGRRLPFGKVMRSRVSGWASRTVSAKPVKKTSSAARLAALYLAAHWPVDDYGTLPPNLPEGCRAALSELVAKGFVCELEGTRYRLGDSVRHLSGVRPSPTVPPRVREEPDPPTWDEWKDGVSAALRRHVEAVEGCPDCALSTARVSEAFMRKALPAQFDEKVRRSYESWVAGHPGQGPLAAEFAATFRAAHGHGPSVKQLCKGLGWGKMPRELRIFAVRRLIADEWLTNTDPVPWTLRPGRAARGGAAPPASVARRR
ncbi:hypothetical protein [Streptomyces sp. NPDC057428]|uniref:hypothetical protein n=1 Tax=Streptomyces sp. NPDC057428 TaxID=3346129 RepID=UPI0036902370